MDRSFPEFYASARSLTGSTLPDVYEVITGRERDTVRPSDPPGSRKRPEGITGAGAEPPRPTHSLAPAPRPCLPAGSVGSAHHCTESWVQNTGSLGPWHGQRHQQAVKLVGGRDSPEEILGSWSITQGSACRSWEPAAGPRHRRREGGRDWSGSGGG